MDEREILIGLDIKETRDEADITRECEKAVSAF